MLGVVVLVAAVAVFIVVMTLALCRVAGDADRRMEEERREEQTTLRHGEF